MMSRGPVDLSPLTSIELPTSASRSGRVSSELITCQELVTQFVDTQRVFNGRLISLQQEINQHKQHIKELKQELSNACQRQLVEGVSS